MKIKWAGKNWAF